MTGIALTIDDKGTGYDLKINIRRDSAGKITQGMVLEETTPQNQTLILVANPGEFKEHPAWGVGLGNIVNDHDFASWRRKIREQIEADGQRITKLELTEKGLTLDAKYK
ncbi:MAG: hypothetical protein ACI3ZV_06585 [Paludibacteraceae bacterium]